jgi:hypothetical protein
MTLFIDPSASASTYPLGWQTRTDIELRDGTLSLQVRPGDLLRSDAGTVWVTVEGQGQDILLLSGQSHRMDADAVVHVSGFGPASLTVIGRHAARLQSPLLPGLSSWIAALRSRLEHRPSRHRLGTALA